MDQKLLNILRCPSCFSDLICHRDSISAEGNILEGKLICDKCYRSYPIIKSIPRFVPIENYTSSFGYQWNQYKCTQVDKFSKTNQSEKRFFAETGWSKNDLKENWVLEVGCGNGRFLEVSSRADCQVVGVDMSEAVDAAHQLYQQRKNVHLVQANIYHLPFPKNYFDKIYCIGVIQHTPYPKKAIKEISVLVKKNGQLALTIYERKIFTLLYAKYLLRPITKRLNKKFLLFTIKLLSPILFVLTEILFRLPILNRLFKFLIPFANYVEMKDLTLRQRFEWAILDTFDMLSPAYDQPMTEREVKQSLEESGIKSLKRLANPGINILAIK